VVAAAVAVAASSWAAHVAVGDEQRALVQARARSLALTVTLGVGTVQSELASLAEAMATDGTSLDQSAAPLVRTGLVAGVGTIGDASPATTVVQGIGDLHPGMTLTGSLWSELGGRSSALAISGVAQIGGRRLVGLVLGSPAAGPHQVLAAVLVTDPSLARAISTGSNNVLSGLQAELATSGPIGHGPTGGPAARSILFVTQHRAPPAGAVTVPVAAAGTRLELTVWPTTALVGALDSNLQWIVLAAGALLWLALVALLRARRQASARARALSANQRHLADTVAELRTANLTDALTGLPNRAFAHLELSDRLARYRPGDARVVVVALGIDGLTQANDVLGPERGDRALQAAAERWRSVLRPDDILARLGGDELVVLCGQPADRSIDLEQLARRFLDTLRQSALTAGDRQVNLQASAGLAIADDVGTTANELLRRAGTALHAARSQAVGSWAVFDRAMDSAVSIRFGVGQDLDRAIDADELHLDYQPLVEIDTGRMVGVEALLRWTRPGHGLVAPSLAVDVAESSGLIGRLGLWVLHTACAQAVAWHGAGAAEDFTVGVNVSVLQLADADIVAAVRGALAQTGCQADWIVLEITETCLIGDVQSTVATLNELRRLGCRLALDDFGTGYSSLDYLTRLPLDIVKVDRSILTPSDGRVDRVEGFLAGIRSITATIGVQVLAEGIETNQQLGLVRSCQFELAQGFLYGRPQPAPDITELVRDHRLLPAGG